MGGSENIVVKTFAIEGNGSRPSHKGSGYAESEIMYTLNITEQHAYYKTGEDMNKHNAVRRLTPVECERLQGFPDGWTDIGDWIDTKGRMRKAADSLGYKALGNSIALPFWFVLMRNISAQYDRPATLGSLFDGIGGFPLVWEQVNGKGTAIWASEIEEFCIAVTKKHFQESED